jgi:hypothetical protein
LRGRRRPVEQSILGQGDLDQLMAGRPVDPAALSAAARIDPLLTLQRAAAWVEAQAVQCWPGWTAGPARG